MTNTLRILQLPQAIQDALINGEITEGHAKILVGLDSEQKQFELFNRIKTRHLNVDTTLLEARRMGGTKQARIQINYADKDKEMILRQFLSAHLKKKYKFIKNMYLDGRSGALGMFSSTMAEWTAD